MNKFISVTIASFISLTSNASPNSNRFDGQYKFVKALGSSSWYSPVNCSEPVALGLNTIDARNTTCQFKEMNLAPEDECNQTLSITGSQGTVIYSSGQLSDSNFESSNSDGLNFFVRQFLKHVTTALYDENIYVSQLNFISNSRQVGFSKKTISFDNSTEYLVMGYTEKKYWASGKSQPDLMKESDVKCFYSRETP